ncbi:Asp-tRNA(Asn)/Glu-tRNA(Gln) amidotransferase subunit GatA [Candidatus Collierbacteria bacterium]|nr:Asp-tRNA(Asn)/Glu-tRNA(Gln) amidotransferase subunit GatA [Candidatus Collierbacteria bacterium]
MGFKISPQEIQHVAQLANLQISDKELKLYTKQIQDILGYVEQLDKVKVEGVEPTYQTLDGTTNVWREDEVKESLSQEEAVGQAEKTMDGYFITDSVFGKGKSTIRQLTEYKKVQESTKREIDGLNVVLTEVDVKGNIGLKDLFLTKGIRSTAGSNVLREYTPQYSSSVIKLLEKAGFATKYKLNCDAWAHGSSGENSDFGPVKNPWNLEFTPGGSSSGSAAAVAAGLVDFATGTDTGGSIRLPASFCGVVGLKPTYGAVSRYGIVAMASSLDSPGIIGRTVEEVEKVFGVMVGEDRRDATSKREGKRGIRRIRRTEEIKIGIPEEFFAEGLDSSVKKAVNGAIEELSKAGLEIKRLSLPHLKYALAVYYLIATTETASNLGRYDGIRYGQDRSFFGAEAKRRIMLGTFASSAGYSAKFFEKAARVRTLIIKDFNDAFKDVDVLIGPVSPTPPFKLGEKANDPLQMYLSDILTVPVNLAGLPGLALPCGFTKNNLPIGMQLIGPRWSENLLFDIGEKYQGLTNWHKERPRV